MDYLSDYLSTFTVPMTRARVAATLKRQQGFNGEVVARHVYAEALALRPGVAIDRVKGRVTTAPDGRFMAFEDVTIALVDYLAWLLPLRRNECEATARAAGWKHADMTPGMLINETRVNPDNGQCDLFEVAAGFDLADVWRQVCEAEKLGPYRIQSAELPPPDLHEYVFDVKLFTTIRIKAQSPEAARAILEGLEFAVSFDPDATSHMTGSADAFRDDGEDDLIEIDGEAV